MCIFNFQIAEIYNTVETHESLTECQEVTLVLENYLRDFNALAEWFRLKWDYENTPAPQRPTSLAWDVCKTNLTRTSRSGKSSPNVGSERSSPCSGKTSPKMLSNRARGNISAPTSPLPTIDQPIIEGKTLELQEPTTICRVSELCQDETKLQENELKNEKSSEMNVGLTKPSKVNSSITKSTSSKLQIKDSLKRRVEDSKNDRSKANDAKSKDGTVKASETKNANQTHLNKADKKLHCSKETINTVTQESSERAETVNDVDSTERNIVVKAPASEIKEDPNTASFQDPAILEIRTKENMPLVNNEKFTKDEATNSANIVRVTDSPSEDQKTYDIFRKTGVESAEKSTSTEDDFPKLPSIKKAVVSKVNQECQTDETEKKPSPINKPKIEPPKTNVTVRTTNSKPAYSTALARSQSAKMVSATKPKVDCKSTIPSRGTATKSLKPVSNRNLAAINTTVSRSGLARSKTVGDIKSTTASNFKPVSKPTKAKVFNKPTIDKKLPPVKAKLTKSVSNDCASSVETLVNHGRSLDNVNLTTSNNSITSSSETINNENVKNTSLHSDGWLTVKNRSRFRSGCQKGRKSDAALSWATRFHQVSATASLPALALLPEESNTNKSLDKTVKDNFNTLKSIKQGVEENSKLSSNRTFLKRSNTTLSKMTVSKLNVIKTVEEKNKTNNIIKSVDKSDEKYKKISDIESETEDNIQDDLATDEEDRKKALQLCEEEERLEKEIAQLQDMEIDVDTETDGTETDGELQCEVDDQNMEELLENEEQMSLETRYEPMLAGNTTISVFYLNSEFNIKIIIYRDVMGRTYGYSRSFRSSCCKTSW